MMRSLWTGAAGMNSQQLGMDTISNNIANVNTHGYKSETVEFQSLLYQSLEKSDVSADQGRLRPVNLQVGHGVKPVAITADFATGAFERTDNTFDFAIDGPGFFTVQTGIAPDGTPEIGYTKAGSFKLSPNNQGTLTLVNSQGMPVLNSEGGYINFTGNETVTVDATGAITVTIGQDFYDTGFSLGIAQFPNPQGLSAEGGGIYVPTAASGAPAVEGVDPTNKRSSIYQGVVEMSNVNIAEEMVKMITTQRAYELNSKVITSSDQMLQQANELKR